MDKPQLPPRYSWYLELQEKIRSQGSETLADLGDIELEVLQCGFRDDLIYFSEFLRYKFRDTFYKFQDTLSKQKNLKWSTDFLSLIQSKSHDIFKTLQNSSEAISLQEIRQRLISVLEEADKRGGYEEMLKETRKLLSEYTPILQNVFNMDQLLKHDSSVVRQYLDDDLIEKLGYANIYNYSDLLHFYKNMDSKEHVINAANTEYHGKPLEVTPAEKTEIEALLRAKGCL